jgi:hypothetical protein
MDKVITFDEIKRKKLLKDKESYTFDELMEKFDTLKEEDNGYLLDDKELQKLIEEFGDTESPLPF